MNIIFSLILPILGSIFIFLCQFYGMKCMGTDICMKKSRRYIIIACYTTLAILLSLPENSIINFLILICSVFIGNRIYHTGKRYMIYYLILVITVYLTDGVMTLFFQTAASYGLIYFNTMELFIAVTIVSCRLVEFMMIRLLVFAVRKNNGSAISKKQIWLALILPIFSMINAFTLVSFAQIYLTETMAFLLILNFVLLVGVNIYFTLLFDRISENARLENELNLFRQQSKMQCEYYEREEKKYENSRELIHDIRNHIETLEQLYRSSDDKDAAAYAGNIHTMLNSFGQNYYTSDKLLNIILNDKIRLMHQYSIHADIKVGDVDMSFLQDVDMTTLFANLLDNAIEAAKNSSEPVIKIRINAVREFISIMLENSCKEEPKRDKNGYISQKSGHHGIGLKNICRVAEAYGGDVQCEWKQGMFYTKIMLVKVIKC